MLEPSQQTVSIDRMINTRHELDLGGNGMDQYLRPNDDAVGGFLDHTVVTCALPAICSRCENLLHIPANRVQVILTGLSLEQWISLQLYCCGERW